MTKLSFTHRFIPGYSADSPVLLLLHGTGGNEEDLIPLGKQLLPGAATLSLRGRVLENGLPRFFKRFAEGVFDLDDLRVQTEALAEFIDGARDEYTLTTNKFIAVGYSNGANIAASLILSKPHVLSDAILFRAMVPFEPLSLPDLRSASIFVGAGKHDPIAREANTKELIGIFGAAGANIEVYWHSGGHELSRGDIDAAKQWLGRSESGSVLTA